MSDNKKLEELLEKSKTDPSVRPEFIKTLFESTVYVIAKKEDSKEVNGKHYEKVKFMNITNKDGEYAIPFFTSEEKLHLVAPGTPFIYETTGFNFFDAVNKANAVLNPNTPSQRAFTSEEIQFLLGLKQIGEAGNDTSNGTKITIRTLEDFPKELAKILSDFFTTKENVNSAFLLEIEYEGRPAHPLLIVEFEGDKAELFPEIGKATEDYLKGVNGFIDIMEYKDTRINDKVMKRATPIYFKTFVMKEEK